MSTRAFEFKGTISTLAGELVDVEIGPKFHSIPEGVFQFGQIRRGQSGLAGTVDVSVLSV